MNSGYSSTNAKKRNYADFMRKETAFLLKQAYEARKERRYGDCADILELAAERSPDAIEIKELLAWAYKDARHPNKAVWAWEALCELRPDSLEYAKRLSDAAHNRGWHRKAISYYERITHLDPGDAKVWENLVECYAMASEHYTAAQACLNAIEVLKDRGAQSASLYYRAFFYTDIAGRGSPLDYLDSIIKLIKAGGVHAGKVYAGIAVRLLGYYRFSGKRKVFAYIRKIVDLLPETDDSGAADLVYAEAKRGTASAGKSYPGIFGRLFGVLAGSDCRDGDAHSELTRMECGILSGIEVYAPFLRRMKSECPELYALHGSFFDEALSDGKAESMLRKRLK